MRIHWLTGVAVAAAMAFAGTAQAEITIAVGAPITGPNAAFGAQIQKGAEMARDDINAAGGINGEQVVLEIGDDASRPEQGVSVANKFVGDGVTIVNGHYNSGVTIPASDVYAENGMLVVTPGATNPTLTERGLWNVVRVCGRDDQQGLVAGAYITQNLGGKKVAIIHDKTPYGQGLADETKNAINAAGITEVMYEGINIGDKDFSALISKMREAGVEVTYFGGLHTEAGLIVRQSADAGLNSQFITGDGTVTDEFAAIAGPAVEGVLVTFGADPRNFESAKDVVQRFRDTGFEPEAYTLYSYAVMQLIQQSATKVGSFDTQQMAALLKSGEVFPTVLGDLSFDEKGDRTDLDYVLYRWEKQPDGKITYIQLPAGM